MNDCFNELTDRPGEVTDQKRLGCLCWQSGPITASLRTDRTGYVSGEIIQFRAEVENLSNRDMDNIFLSLVEVVTYQGWHQGSHGDKMEETVVEKVRREENIRPRSVELWEGRISLPSLPPTGLAGNCGIIDVQYWLDLCVDPTGPSFDLVVRLPIMLGTLPIQLQESQT